MNSPKISKIIAIIIVSFYMLKYIVKNDFTKSHCVFDNFQNINTCENRMLRSCVSRILQVTRYYVCTIYIRLTHVFFFRCEKYAFTIIYDTRMLQYARKTHDYVYFIYHMICATFYHNIR